MDESFVKIDDKSEWLVLVSFQSTEELLLHDDLVNSDWADASEVLLHLEVLGELISESRG